jgi:serine phosphatase RsbU (regulator of sigma subunit)
MANRSELLVLFLVLLSASALLAQPNNHGVPLVSNYPHEVTLGGEQNWCITQDARGVIYVGNHDKGILEYDGVEWRRIPIPNDPATRSLVQGDDGRVYVGAVSEFGYLAPDPFGKMQYRSLSDSLDKDLYPFSAVWRTYSHQGRIYFCSFNFIFIYDLGTEMISVLETGEFSFYSFLADGILYVSDYGEGLMRFREDQLVAVPGGDFFREMTITGLVPFGDSCLLVGTFYRGLFLYNLHTGEVDEAYANREVNEYLIESNIAHIGSFRKAFVVSTLSGGVVILERNGQASAIISEKEGLIDQQVPFVYFNEKIEGSSQLWIANFMGVSKLEPENPFRVFTESAGFEDFITDIQVFDERLFISTFGGLYYLATSATGTQFIRVPVTRGAYIRDLLLFEPTAGREFLLASSHEEVYVIDKQMNASFLEDLVTNPPDDPSDRAEYAGPLLQDPRRSDRLFVGRTQVVGLQYNRGQWEEFMRVKDLGEQEIMLRKCIDRHAFFWSSTEFTLSRVDIRDPNLPMAKSFDVASGLPANDKNLVFLDPENDEVLLGTRDGFYRYDYFRDTIVRDTFYNSILPPGRNRIMAFHQDGDGDFWFSFENAQGQWTELLAGRMGDHLEIIEEKAFQRLANVSVDVFYTDPWNKVWFGKSNKLYQFDKDFVRDDSVAFRALIRSVGIGSDSLIYFGSSYGEETRRKPEPQISHALNSMRFTWAAPFFEQEEEIEFSYRLAGFEDSWSPWSKIPFKEFTNLPYGSYALELKARNVYGIESIPAHWPFTILRPWYAKFYAIVLYVLLAVLLVYVIIKLYTRRLKNENLRLEEVIQERTAEIRKQKEELTDSIEYASRIQRALLPSEKLLDKYQIEHFILFKPRDIVSGDFYWIGSRNNRLVVVAADCTGHGVPGAFMSMLGMTFLDEIVIKSEITRTDQILEDLREHVISALKQTGELVDESKDGMDLSLISIDLLKQDFQYSGAYNPLYLVRKLKRSETARLNKGEELDLPRGCIHNQSHLLQVVRADQMPIGISEKKRSFHSTHFENEGFNIYMFSDGFLDQFGGPKGKKFMSKNFKKLILELQSLPLSEQGAAMEKVLYDWMGDISQIDDILVMGLRIKEQ